MDYRVDELAEAAGISVQLVRSYQSKGLLRPPHHEGRIALYDGRHLERLREINELKRRGYSLRVIGQLLESGPPRADPTDGDVAEIVDEETFDLRELADRSGVPTPMLRSLEASGLIRSRRLNAEGRYTHADVRAVSIILTLVGGGLPLEELMKVARIQLEAAEDVAEGSVSLFMSHVRAPLQEMGLSQREHSDRLVAALRLMLHSSAALLAYNFQRMVLNAIQEEINELGTRSERSALQREILRRLELDVLAQ
ncbi:MAG TPA: MerR family transcriptional regulator [Acidimicrobiales bacterium]|jgi:DNA-binding transcriptional MerR regulator|nr:MerR family transcriptional regulator [Acidimicrobiales bacterium]